MSDTLGAPALRLLEALLNYRTAMEDPDHDENVAALLAVGMILIAFPGATLLREIIETSFPRANRPATNDSAALRKMAELVANGQGLKPASRLAVQLASPGASEDAIAQRLRRKFRSSRDQYLGSDQSALIIDDSRRLIRDLVERKAEQVGRPYDYEERRLRQALRDLERKLADWEERRGTKVPEVKNPDSEQKM